MEWIRRNYSQGLSPGFMRAFNFWAMVLFIVLIPPSVIWWNDSVPYLVAISVWANIAGHLSAWQASRVEERQEAETDELEEETEDLQETTSHLNEGHRHLETRQERLEREMREEKG